MSSPGAYAADLARATGRFYTQGMPEDTKGLKTGVLTAAEFLQQARIAADENRTTVPLRSRSVHDGFLFYYFGNVDQVSHMMWRAMDPEHPAYDGPTIEPHTAPSSKTCTSAMDAIVGERSPRLVPTISSS